MNSSHLFSRIYSILVLLLFVQPLFGQWVNLKPDIEGSLEQVDLVSADIGYGVVMGQNWNRSLYKTSDGGSSWILVDFAELKEATYDVQGMSFVDEKVGYVILRVTGTPIQSYVLKTDDGGNSWLDVTPGQLPIGTGTGVVQFADAKVGSASSGNVVFSTWDGGVHWTRKDISPWHNLEKMNYYNTDKAVAGAWDGTFAYKGLIYTTHDGGSTWDSFDLEESNTAIRSVQYVNEHMVIALTRFVWMQSQRLYISTNEGASWEIRYLEFLVDSVDEVRDIYFSNANIGILVTSKGYIYRTTDQGKTWELNHFQDEYLGTIEHYGKSLFVAGSPGLFLTNSIILTSPQILSGSNQIYPNPCRVDGVLKLNVELPAAFEVYDLMGRHITTGVAQDGDLHLSDFQLKSGSYLVSLPQQGFRTILLVE